MQNRKINFPNKNKGTEIQFRVTQEEKDLIKTAAKEKDMTMSEYIVKCVLAEVNKSKEKATNEH